MTADFEQRIGDDTTWYRSLTWHPGARAGLSAGPRRPVAPTVRFSADDGRTWREYGTVTADGVRFDTGPSMWQREMDRLVLLDGIKRAPLVITADPCT